MRDGPTGLGNRREAQAKGAQETEERRNEVSLARLRACPREWPPRQEGRRGAALGVGLAWGDGLRHRVRGVV